MIGIIICFIADWLSDMVEKEYWFDILLLIYYIGLCVIGFEIYTICSYVPTHFL